MAMYPKDIVYDDIRDVAPVAAVTKGYIALVEDCVGFYLTDVEASTEGAFITAMKQVLADKAVGTGEAINAGAKVYVDLTLQKVSGTKGAGMYYVGNAKETVAADTPQVLIDFNGRLATDTTL